MYESERFNENKWSLFYRTSHFYANMFFSHFYLQCESCIQKKKICRLFSPTLMYILDFIDIITTIIHLLASLNILNIEVLSSFIRFSRRHIHIHLFFFLYSSIFLLCSVHFVLSDSLKYHTLRQSVPFRLA